MKLGSLEDDDGEVYDQFKGKKSTYKDEIYTTKIDQSKVTKEVAQLAERKEREILSQSSNGNVHLAEERQQVTQSEDYEEMKYSGVYR